ncbi:unnamed protein product [Haemonchus placei]|uniref:Transposase n=1 Tax=Haemonchus placei TaxID=6290 RepID=A0A0N4W4N7_HAEPC|nr:unnamed protein product [Haemonchus placei]
MDDNAVKRKAARLRYGIVIFIRLVVVIRSLKITASSMPSIQRITNYRTEIMTISVIL